LVKANGVSILSDDEFVGDEFAVTGCLHVNMLNWVFFNIKADKTLIAEKDYLVLFFIWGPRSHCFWKLTKQQH
jgi:hypothetical protein